MVKNKGLIEYEKNRKKATRKLILDSIISLKQKGEKVNINRISKESGISRTTLYEYRDYIESSLEKLKQEPKSKDEIIKTLKEENKKLKEDIKSLKSRF